MEPAFLGIPRTVAALAALLGLSALLALAARRRGGRFRGLPGWVGFWGVFAGILVSLSRFPTIVSRAMLGLLMYAALRTYASLAPVRQPDRWAILAAYLAVPFAIYVSQETFFATVPLALVLLFPVLLSAGRPQEGLLDSMGRILLGVGLFVYSAAHIGLLVRADRPGLLELFGILVLGAELPGRLTGRFRQGGGWARSSFGVAAGLLFATALGYFCAPWCRITHGDGGRAGFLVALAVTLGALVSEAVMRDLTPGMPAVRVGRWAFLDRVFPPIYAAPVFFHYLNHFA